MHNPFRKSGTGGTYYLPGFKVKSIDFGAGDVTWVEELPEPQHGYS